MKKIFSIPVFFALMLASAGTVFGQAKTVMNLSGYDSEKLHFGFALGLNSANFQVTPVKDLYKNDSLKTIDNVSQLGFNLGIITDYKLYGRLNVRFCPYLSFAQRNLDFYFAKTDTIHRIKRVESTFIDFPINLKLRSDRLNNIGMYLLGGLKFSIDLASQKDANNANIKPGQEPIKLKKNDIAYEAGAGFDMYFPYFKLAIEGKLSVGMSNLLIKDNTVFSNSIEKLRSQIFQVSFTFEG